MRVELALVGLTRRDGIGFPLKAVVLEQEALWIDVRGATTGADVNAIVTLRKMRFDGR